jgi:hypothetical protein
MSWLSRTRSLQCFFAEQFRVFLSVTFGTWTLFASLFFLLLVWRLGLGVLISVGVFCYVRRITTDTRTTCHSVLFLWAFLVCHHWDAGKGRGSCVRLG